MTDLVKRLRECDPSVYLQEEAASSIEALERDRLAWRIAMQRLTPGGSEFMTPQACEEYAAMLKRETVEAKLAKVRSEQALASALQRLAEIVEIATWEQRDREAYIAQGPGVLIRDMRRIATIAGAAR